MAAAHKHAAMFGVLMSLACLLGCEAASGFLARRMAMGDMPIGSMANLTGTPLVVGNASYILASRDFARQGYPWCATSVTTAYFLQPNISTVTNNSQYVEYAFKMDEDYGMCREVLTRKNRTSQIATMCSTPFYSFMMAISSMCHEAVMKVKTVQMFSKQDVAGAVATEMYAHAHKGNDTGVPLLKYLIKPAYLTPSSAPGAKRRFVLTLRINKVADNPCRDLATLCGGNTCMAALSDEEYEQCPAFFARMA